MLLYTIQHLLLGIFRGHLQKEVSNLSKDFRISKFCKIELSHHIDKQKLPITRLILKIQDSNVPGKANLHSRKNPILASKLKDHF